MANVLVDESSLQNIADTIRAKGGTGSYKPSQMASAIVDVYNNGIAKEVKLFSPYINNEGKDITVLWDILQDKGNRTDYSYLFTNFTDNSFKPKYDMFPEKSMSMFELSKITDLAALLNNAGVVLDIRGLTFMPYRMFAFSTMTHCPGLTIPPALNLNCMFYGCKQLETIDSSIVTVDNVFTLTFNGCISLKNITFEEGSEIGSNVSFKDSPLSKQSIESIVNTLSDNVKGKTLTLKKNAVTSAFLQEINFLAEAVNPSFVVLTCYAEGYKLDMGDGTYDYWGVDIEFDGNNYHLNEGYNEVLLSVSKDYFSSSGDIRDDITVADNSFDGKISNVKVYTTAYLEWQDLVNSKPNWTISLV